MSRANLSKVGSQITGSLQKIRESEGNAENDVSTEASSVAGSLLIFAKAGYDRRDWHSL